jgi:hypothetical protein
MGAVMTPSAVGHDPAHRCRRIDQVSRVEPMHLHLLDAPMLAHAARGAGPERRHS